MQNCILVRPGEITLKGRNRDDFERRLLRNLDFAVKKADENARVVKIYSGFIIEDFSNETKIIKSISKVFGISNYCIARKVVNDIEKIKEAAVELVKKRNPVNFKVAAKRSNKGFSYTSMQINNLVGECVIDNLGTKVNVTSPDMTVYVDVSEKFTFVYSDKISALGGLPVGCSGEVISMISGGIDSPVASFMANKRGCHITYITFESYPFTSKQAVEKVRELVEVLSSYQKDTVLYVVPFSEIQKEIKAKCLEKNRTVLYRRMMVRIANMLAKKSGGEAIVTGEAVGQVASQTLTNISCIDAVSEIPILRPLIMFDKIEIIDLAKKIETYDISIKPHADCCTVFQPENPAIHAKSSELLDDEKKLDIDTLVQKAFGASEIVKF